MIEKYSYVCLADIDNLIEHRLRKYRYSLTHDYLPERHQRNYISQLIGMSNINRKTGLNIGMIISIVYLVIKSQWDTQNNDRSQDGEVASVQVTKPIVPPMTL